MANTATVTANATTTTAPATATAAVAVSTAADGTARIFDLVDAVTGLEVHLQPIVDLATGAPIAYEALARFRTLRGVPVDAVIAAAHDAGHGYDLEAACLRAALGRRDALPAGARLAVNVSPDVLLHPVVRRAWPARLDGIVVEVTEHRASHTTALDAELRRLRSRGAQLAVDDVGTGYAGLLRLAAMTPDFVKVDRSVVTGAGSSEAQAAVLEALVTFAHRTHAAVIGEGVESLADIASLAAFDVDYAQGYAIGMPDALVAPVNPLIVAACRHARSAVLQQQTPHTARAGTGTLPVAISAMATATGLPELQAATARAAAELGIDCIGVSVLDPADGTLHEIGASGTPLDAAPYDLADFPSTREVLETAGIVEVHLADADADTADVQLLRAQGNASLLVVPLLVADRPVGVLEFGSRIHRRWSSHDVALGRGLAAHAGAALVRITG